jgi:glutathione synthase/RimK-type ligase-like ATP-grasp enzyme
MILVAGIPSETPLAMVCGHLREMGARVVVFNQRQAAKAAIAFELAAGEVSGWLRLDGSHHRLEDFRGIYYRLMDDQVLPELEQEPAASPRRLRVRTLHETLSCWSELSPARVVNRLAAVGSNGSKPYQLQLIRAHGFAVPETLITNEPEQVLAFRARHRQLVFKSMSGIRSIVQLLEDGDLDRLERIRWCPVQFQQFVDGTNVRVHTVGQSVFATAIETRAIDYRYARRQVGEAASLRAVELPSELAERCVRLARALGLDFAGIDLKQTPGGEIYCFEVNPMPGFSYYEAQTGQPIAREVARYLREEIPVAPVGSPLGGPAVGRLREPGVRQGARPAATAGRSRRRRSQPRGG